MIKHAKPTSAGRRAQTHLKSAVTMTKPRKSAIKNLTSKNSGAVGRSKGRITVQNRHRGAKRLYRVIDFKRDNYGVDGVIEAIEYDPNRTCNIALVLFVDGDRRYILAPAGVKPGDKVISGDKADIRVGNALPLGKIPTGTPIHNIEIYPKGGGKLVRSAGSAAYVTAREGDYVNVRMPSGEVRRALASCFATIGQLGNDEWKLISIGKAGRAFHMGKRPHTRGKARSDGHPLGGSYSRRLGRQPVDKWGNISKGGKTRHRKHTDKYIVRSRRAK